MVGWPNRRFLELVGTEHPIVQAPMANAGGVDLCVAASEAGALGSLPCGMLSPDQTREQVAEVRSRVSAPLNLNFLCHRMPEQVDDSPWRARLRPYYAALGIDDLPAVPLRQPFDDTACEAVEEIRPEVISFHFGLPDEGLLRRVRQTGAVVIACATTVEEARWLEDRGADAIIAQGYEAGGHRGRFLGATGDALGLVALVPQIVDAVRVPVIAAGGISDGRAIAAAFALGASAVQLGTAYLHCPESLLPAGHKALLTQRPTVATTVYSGGLARALRGRLVEEVGAVPAEAPPYPVAGAVTMPLFRAAIERGDFDLLPSLAGQGAPLGQPLPAGELTRKLATDALAILSPTP